MIMTLYHGTQDCLLESFQKTLPKKYERRYLPRSRKAFSTSTNFEEAVRFALRATPASDLTKTGVVLEFIGNLIPQKDFLYSRDPHSLFDEKEVSVFAVERIQLIAVHRFNHQNGEWYKCLLPVAVS